MSSIVALPKGPREVLVREIAWNADEKALDLATALAKVETDPDVLVSVISALSVVVSFNLTTPADFD